MPIIPIGLLAFREPNKPVPQRNDFSFEIANRSISIDRSSVVIATALDRSSLRLAG